MDDVTSGYAMNWSRTCLLTLVTGAALATLALLFRLPVFLNPDAMDSDAAVVALQSRHLLEGPDPLLLWGTRYQGITGPTAVALVGLLLPGKLTLIGHLAAVLGHCLLVLALFSILRRRTGNWIAFVLTSLVVFMPEPGNTVTYTGYRNWAYTLLFVALYFVDRGEASETGRGKLICATLAGMAAGLAHYTDLFVSQLLPGIAIVATGWVWREPRRRLLGGVLVTAYALASLPRLAAGMDGPRFSEFSFSHLDKSWALLQKSCMPYVLGAKLYPTFDGFSRPLHDSGPLAQVACVAGLTAMAVLSLLGIGSLVTRRAWRTNGALVLCGLSWAATCVATFLFTDRAVDIMSSRYLVPILLGLPLIAAGMFRDGTSRWLRLGGGGLAICCCIHFGISGWLGYGQFVSGIRPVETAWGTATAERNLLGELVRRNLSTGIADFWVAYRLDAVLEERVVIGAVSGSRYEPYERLYSDAAQDVRIFFPLVPYHSSEAAEQELRNARRPYEIFSVDGYTVLVTPRESKKANH